MPPAAEEMPERVQVIGAGVSGLTCAVRLLEEGIGVRVVAERQSPATTSDAAGALWFPYRVGLDDRAAAWSRVSYRRFEEMAAAGGAGVTMTEVTVVYAEPLASEPWWLAAVPDGRVRAVLPGELPAGYAEGRVVQVPMIEPPRYLAHLARRVEAMGGTVEEGRVDRLDRGAGRVVVNCAGVGAGTLAGDPSVRAIRGQVVYVRPRVSLRALIAEEGPNALAYVLPRPDLCVLGGTAEEGDRELRPRPATTDDILTRTRRLEPGLDGAEVLGSAVGLRPVRDEVRLEAELLPGRTRVIHDYGHGGSGYTLSWGCADEVARLAAPA